MLKTSFAPIKPATSQKRWHFSPSLPLKAPSALQDSSKKLLEGPPAWRVIQWARSGSLRHHMAQGTGLAGPLRPDFAHPSPAHPCSQDLGLGWGTGTSSNAIVPRCPCVTFYSIARQSFDVRSEGGPGKESSRKPC